VVAKRVTWKKWPKTAYKYKLCLFDWPDAVEPPGPSFDYKSLSKSKLDKLIRGYVKNKEEGTDDYVQPNIERWGSGNCLCFPTVSSTYETHKTADITLSDLNAKKGDIPLVVTEDGNIVMRLSDCFEWRCDQYEETRRLQNQKGSGYQTKKSKKARPRHATAESSSESDEDRLRTRSNKSKCGRGIQEKSVSSDRSENEVPVTKSRKSGPEQATRNDLDFVTTTPERPTKKVRPSQPAQWSARPRPRLIGQSSAAIVITPALGAESIVRAEASSSQPAQAQVARASSSITNLPNWAHPLSGSRNEHHLNNPSRFGKTFDRIPKPHPRPHDRSALHRFDQDQDGYDQWHQGHDTYGQRRPTHTTRHQEEDDGDMEAELSDQGAYGDHYMDTEYS
jgi:hypothetical protein